MARSINVAMLTFGHISMVGDSMTILFSHDKTHEGGDGLVRHVYANPLIPCVCVFLAFGLHVMTSPPQTVSGKGTRVFSGAFPETTFGRWLQLLLVKIATNVDQMLRLEGGAFYVVY